MIENMRKYTGLMVVVLILLAAGLILTMGDFRANTGGRAKVTEVYGEGIDQIEFNKMGRNSLSVIKELKDTNLSIYALSLISNSPLNWQALMGFHQRGSSSYEALQFVTRRIVIAKTAADYGIYPSTTQAETHIKEKIFSKDEKFDAERYREFMKNIGKSGLNETDFVNLVAESLVYERLKKLISDGLQTPNSLTDRAIKFQQQTLDFTTISIDIEKYKKEIKPTEEEIETYWKENDFKYLTDREIRISYLIQKPVYSSPRPIAPVRAPDTTDEDFKKIDEAHRAALAKWELDIEKPADKLAASIIDDLAYKVDDSDGLKFEEEAAAANIKLTSTELFSSKNVPSSLKLLNSKEGQSISALIFETKISDSLKYRIPAPVKLEGNGWFYVRYDEDVQPVTKTYEQAKELAKADYIQEKAHAAMLADTTNVKDKLTKLIASGTSAADAAKANNLIAEARTGVNYGNLGRTGQNISPSEFKIFENASVTDHNSFSQNNVDEKEQVILVYLNKREVINTPEIEDMRVNYQKRTSSMLQESVFRAWLDDAIAKANIPAMKVN